MPDLNDLSWNLPEDIEEYPIKEKSSKNKLFLLITIIALGISIAALLIALTRTPTANNVGQGTRGPAGPPGEPGAPGVPGSPGSPGAPGSPGSSGADGSSGPQGPSGSSGPQGSTGPAGADGNANSLGLGQGEIEINAPCDSSISVTLNSTFNFGNRTFYLSDVTLSEIAIACYGGRVSIYIYDGSTNSLSPTLLANTTSPYSIGNASSVSIPISAFTPSSVESARITNMTFEVQS
jgi:hypothetical protein